MIDSCDYNLCTPTHIVLLTGEVLEFKAELHSSDKHKKKDAVKKVIAAMTVGKDVSMLFPDVVNCMQVSLPRYTRRGKSLRSPLPFPARGHLVIQVQGQRRRLNSRKTILKNHRPLAARFGQLVGSWFWPILQFMLLSGREKMRKSVFTRVTFLGNNFSQDVISGTHKAHNCK
jgi:hypothetical protein